MSEIPHPNITHLVVNNYRSLKDIDVGLHPQEQKEREKLGRYLPLAVQSWGSGDNKV